MLTPCGHGSQYLHPVHGIVIRFSNSCFYVLEQGEFCLRGKEFGNPFFAHSTFCRTCSGADVPERTTVACGWFPDPAERPFCRGMLDDLAFFPDR